MTKPEIIVCPDAAALARQGAEQFIARAGEAVARVGRFAVALSGGSTPAALYSLLAAEFRERVDWPRVHLFWGDERCVPPDHPDSNFRMTREHLLERIQLPPENIHRMQGEAEPVAAAAAYESELRKFFGAGLARFDLVLLGLGEDGHTASLFPGSAAAGESERLVTTVYVERLRSHRLTLTLPAINAASQVIFLISGANKRAIVKQLLDPGMDSSNFPAVKVSPTGGKLTWLITEDAADGLSAKQSRNKE